jgi:Xaa-Pro aminopeptidase
VSADRTVRRRDALRARLRGEDLDAFLVTNETNVTYLTGFSGDSTALFVGRGGRDLMVSDGRYADQIAQECPGLEAFIRPIEQTLPAALGATAAGLGARRIGIEADSLTVATARILTEAVGPAELVALEGRVEALRAVKDAGEVAAIRRAIDIAERAFAAVLEGLTPDQSEADVADALEAALRRCGARAASFPPIVAVGARAALPHARPELEARLADAPFVLIDWGAATRPLPYKSDLTRVVATGNVTSEFERVYGIVLEAQARAIAAVRPGATAESVDLAARSVIEEAGFGPYFTHGLGHGIGLDIHEAPRLRRGVEDALAPGMVVTIEPGIYRPSWGGLRVEDDVLVTPDGCEVLTGVPKALDRPPSLA